MSPLTIGGLRKKKILWFLQTEIESLSSSPLWYTHCWVNHGLVEGKMQPCIKSPKPCCSRICSDCLFFVQSTEALSYKEKPCKVLEWPHRKDSFRTCAFCRVWFLMTHYRKFTMRKGNKGDFNFFQCFKFPVLEFKMEKKKRC